MVLATKWSQSCNFYSTLIQNQLTFFCICLLFDLKKIKLNRFGECFQDTWKLQQPYWAPFEFGQYALGNHSRCLWVRHGWSWSAKGTDFLVEASHCNHYHNWDGTYERQDYFMSLQITYISNVQKVKHLSPFLERGTFLRNGTGMLYIFSHLESKVKERPFSKGFNRSF